ncbi:MAG: RNA polymerase sigma factor [Deltaproteobacteria bacterium]|nr:RNA polymerase sigma factor [Deltaproteobacteria bacterium]
MTDEPQGGGSEPVVLREEDLADHIPVIRSYLRKILRKDEIEDGVQTVMARALENLERFRGESTPRVWLLGIARNVGYELARSRQRQPILVETEEEASTGSIDLPKPTQEEMLGAKEQQALTLTALDGLSLDEKLALLVTYVDGLPGPEAAEILGVSFAAFRQRLSRARQALAKALERVMREGAPGSAEVLAQWKALLDPHGTVRGSGSDDSSP